MNALFHLNLEENHFQASDAKDLSFIDSLVNCSNLQVFSIYMNDLEGVLPLSLANFSKELWFLGMAYNHFSGIIPHGIENLISLNIMHFTGNDLTGQIPEHIGNIPMLQSLGFGDNKLTGYIPSSIGNLTQLVDFNISRNKFEGTIPSTMKNLHHLTKLNLSDNSFSGRIPGEIFSQLLSLRVLDLANNSFNGTIPSEIGGLINLQQLLLNGNELSGEIPGSISGCAILEDLNLQGNLFTGSIPSSLGNLKGLRNLNFSDNSLSGGIPSSFSNLKFLEVLSLSNNSLSGSIPEFLEDFKFLTVLDLSYNDFHGELPVKGVFGNSSAVLSVAGNGERPVDERFKDGMTMRKFVEICASHDRIMEVIDQSMFSREQEDGDIEHGDISSARKKIECLVSVVALGIACSVESPNDRLGMNDVAAQMHAVRDKFVEFGVHGVKQEVSPAKLTIPLIVGTPRRI
ncbi:hypothetical protein J5N97_006336 [Dioscorea zingiberensis]|uniref:Uncharacterized protein n=1 Tax=Dioscorea zingiberensis TaxID=325984 RepID=A0A9D5D9S0_9LILI|nr:hypothetical protein J5N97_006336 [Dioscorea zingiberensis]